MCIIVDYTGGTKTMAGSLLLAAVEDGQCEISLVTGDRPNLVRVADGTEMAGLVSTSGVQLQRRLAIAEELFDRYDYRAAQTVLEDLARSVSLSAQARTTLQKYVTLARGFDAWDAFDHAAAFNLLKPHAGALGIHWTALLALNGKGSRKGYERVFDMILNAERSAARGRYDDAIARLYRTVELLAQLRLDQEYEVDTSNVQVDKLPEALRPCYQPTDSETKVQLGLRDAYSLLQQLDDPLGKAYEVVQGPLRNALTARNNSILAHGEQPVGKEAYQNLHDLVSTLIDQSGQVVEIGSKPAQFPSLHDVLPVSD
jgi:hypothetical protein